MSTQSQTHVEVALLAIAVSVSYERRLVSFRALLDALILFARAQTLIAGYEPVEDRRYPNPRGGCRYFVRQHGRIARTTDGCPSIVRTYLLLTYQDHLNVEVCSE